MRLPAVAHSFLVPFSHPPAPESGQQQDAIWVVDAAQFDFVKGMGDSVSQHRIQPVLFQGTDVLWTLSLWVATEYKPGTVCEVAPGNNLFRRAATPPLRQPPLCG